MNYRLILLLGTTITALAFTPIAGAQMSYAMVQHDRGMNYSGEIANSHTAVRSQGDTGMNYAGEITNTPAAVAVVPLDVAVKAAEKRVAGNAFRAELGRTNSGPAYLVEFAGNGAQTNVWVDAKSGKVERTQTVHLASFSGE